MDNIVQFPFRCRYQLNWTMETGAQFTEVFADETTARATYASLARNDRVARVDLPERVLF